MMFSQPCCAPKLDRMNNNTTKVKESWKSHFFSTHTNTWSTCGSSRRLQPLGEQVPTKSCRSLPKPWQAELPQWLQSEATDSGHSQLYGPPKFMASSPFSWVTSTGASPIGCPIYIHSTQSSNHILSEPLRIIKSTSLLTINMNNHNKKLLSLSHLWKERDEEWSGPQLCQWKLWQQKASWLREKKGWLFCPFPKAPGLQEMKEKAHFSMVWPHIQTGIKSFFNCTKKKVACACFKCTYTARVQDLLIPQFNSALWGVCFGETLPRRFFIVPCITM